MDKELIYSAMEMLILASIKMGNLMAKDNTLGKMGLCMWESLGMDSNMGKASGEVEKDPNVTPMKVTMLQIRRMDMEYSNGRVGISTKESTGMMRGMDLVR